MPKTGPRLDPTADRGTKGGRFNPAITLVLDQALATRLDDLVGARRATGSRVTRSRIVRQAIEGYLGADEFTPTTEELHEALMLRLQRMDRWDTPEATVLIGSACAATRASA